MGKKILLILLVIVMVLGVAWWRTRAGFLFPGSSVSKNEVVKMEGALPQEVDIQLEAVSEEKTIVAAEVSAQGGSALSGKAAAAPQSSLIENVPFTVQAPFGEWNISTFQNGCEEAAVVMAAYFVSGKTLTQEVAKKEILALAKFEDKKHGQSIDTSAADTSKLFEEYYGIATSEVRTDITLTDIQEVLAMGAIVIVPADGRALHNPNYKQPGPTTHMLVVIGYDAKKKEFITNDSGTKNGRGYRYDEDVLYEAIRDYPTGDHLPIIGMHKDMIVVRKP